ncbi:MAG: response regulator transcription factor [Bacteriovoracaceae bacterium]|jgi:DNA-binding response OmpR family regulator|nr:response regulator transcription factor [Bacteriovoracaceae bacterium]
MKGKILVVEDNLNLQTLIQKSLDKEFEVITCSNAEEAYDKFEQEDFFLVLLDINLPGMSGYEFAGTIKSLAETQNPFILVMSANASNAAKLTALNLGAIGFLEKPFDIRYLRKLAQNLFTHQVKEYGPQHNYGDIEIDFSKSKISIHEQQICLTQAEINILKELVSNSDSEVSRERLFLVSGNHKSEAGTRVVDTHISSIRKKIKDSKIEIKSIYGKGYKINKAA